MEVHGKSDELGKLKINKKKNLVSIVINLELQAMLGRDLRDDEVTSHPCFSGMETDPRKEGESTSRGNKTHLPGS